MDVVGSFVGAGVGISEGPGVVGIGVVGTGVVGDGVGSDVGFGVVGAVVGSAKRLARRPAPFSARVRRSSGRVAS